MTPLRFAILVMAAAVILAIIGLLIGNVWLVFGFAAVCALVFFVIAERSL